MIGEAEVNVGAGGRRGNDIADAARLLRAGIEEGGRTAKQQRAHPDAAQQRPARQGWAGGLGAICSAHADFLRVAWLRHVRASSAKPAMVSVTLRWWL